MNANARYAFLILTTTGLIIESYKIFLHGESDPLALIMLIVGAFSLIAYALVDLGTRKVNKSLNIAVISIWGLVLMFFGLIFFVIPSLPPDIGYAFVIYVPLILSFPGLIVTARLYFRK